VRNIGPEGVMPRIRSLQERQLSGLLRSDRLARLVEQEAFNGAEAYVLTDMLEDLRTGLWAELGEGESIDGFRRNLQRSHVAKLGVLLDEDIAKRTDVGAAARAELRMVREAASNAVSKYKPGIISYIWKTWLHLSMKCLTKTKMKKTFSCS